jgi:NAD(P)-dependent dehydrogenase (short-subunit alcohol dehydrogenase family)
MATWQGTGIYCASKFALEAIGETLAEEVAGLGIKVINVEPGGMRTDYASRSLVRAVRKVADYDSTAHQSERILAGHAGSEAGDPGKMARAILSIVAMEKPPRNLLLGADAMHYATRRMGALLAEFGHWAPVTLDTKFDA